MGNVLTRFCMDRRSFVRYVVSWSLSLTLVLTNLVRNKVRRTFHLLSTRSSLLTGMDISQHLRLRTMCPRVADEGLEEMEFVSWSRPFCRSHRGI